ncbi:hypothetical protein SCHPADRAFT_941428 [Schizopora paradoxa]|uniref:DUF6533 domain-containing protein n=1 Tax=Schizopora paradoxa TaxID=27342 RepID=A0A0H2RKJ7_9AGAM|nr:hypothetical protein SCHPADRAFT_941428 [Schizopora paradoxa]
MAGIFVLPEAVLRAIEVGIAIEVRFFLSSASEMPTSLSGSHPFVSRTKNVFVSSLNSPSLAVSSFTMLVYDFWLLLPVEIEFIWRTEWRSGKILYIATRYVPLLSLTLITVANFNNSITPPACNALSKSAVWLLLIESVIAEAILFLRTYAIWGKSKTIMIICLVLFALFIPGFAVLKLSLDSIEYLPSPLPTLTACFIFNREPSHFQLFSLDYAMLCFSEFVVVVLTGWKAITEYKRGSTPLLDVLYRDGFWFFALLFGISLLNAAVTKLSFTFAWIQCVFHSVLTSRVILHLHEANASQNVYPDGTLSTMRFSGDVVRSIDNSDVELAG